MATLAIILFVYLFVLPMLRLILFIVVNIRTGQWAALRDESRSGLLSMLARLYGTAVISDALVLATIPFMKGPKPCGTHTPAIVLVHGLYHAPSAWTIFQHKLADVGYSNIYRYGYNSLTKDFNGAWQGLAEKLDQVLAANPQGVVLVGHSLGGMIARRAAAEPRFAGCIKGLATLGTPHGGSDLAILGVGKLARGLLPGGAVMTEVASVEDTDAPKLGVFTTTDDFVMPYGLLTPPQGWLTHICPPMGHIYMLYSPTVLRTVIGFIEHLHGDGSQLSRECTGFEETTASPEEF